MRLLTLRLKNFKGITDFTFSPQGKNARIYADNGVGKSTLADAFHWLLTGKNSLNQADFEIKTLDADNNPIHNLEHEVEGEFEHNGKTFTLRKVYYEKWTKRRGQAKSEFSGHVTDHFIDGVPKPKKDYDAFIASLADERTFKLLTNPLFFNDDNAMKSKTEPGWKVRRRLLIEIFGDVSDGDVIASDKKLFKLTEILGSRSLDDHRAIIKARQGEINKELEKIPIRINEVNGMLPDITGLDAVRVTQDIAKTKEEIKEQEQALTRLQSGGEVAEKQKRIREIEAELLNLKNQNRAAIDEKISEKRKELNALNSQWDMLDTGINSAERKIKATNDEIDGIEKKLEELRKEYRELAAKEFVSDVSDTCPTCGQSLPADEVEAAIEKAKSDFNLKKANRLEEINKTGVTGKENKELFAATVTDLQTKITKDTAELTAVKDKHYMVQEAIDELKQQAENMPETPEQVKLIEEKQTLTESMTALVTGTTDEQDTINKEIDRLSVALLAMETNLTKFDTRKTGETRIKELEAQEKTLAAEYERLEGEMFLCDNFVKAKVSLLEEKINAPFKLARYKMYESQINGGIAECCETLVNGVPYGGGLNHSAQINVGLEQINVFSQYFGFEAPVFIDNREAVTELFPIKAQAISLIVSEKDKVLRVETE